MHLAPSFSDPASTCSEHRAHVTRCEACRFALRSAQRYHAAMQRVARATRASDALRERVVLLLQRERESRPT